MAQIPVEPTRLGVHSPDDIQTAGAPSLPPGAAPEEGIVPGQVLAHYRIMGRLGAGGFGTVWRAEDLHLGREVAIKFLARRISQDAASRALLEAEARTVAALGHPGVVTLHALEEAEGRLFLVMEHVQGRVLAELVPPEGLPLDRVLDLALQIVDAMARTHEHGIIHRDLNPRNIMVTGEGRAKVLDFGLALRRATKDPALPEASPSPSGGLAGTISYMSPEQVEGRALDARSDLFSLGMLIYEMAFGHRPFRGDTLHDVMDGIRLASPTWPEGAPPSLVAILRRCMEKDPARRFASCRELQQALVALKRQGTSGSDGAGSAAVLPFEDLSPDRDEDHFCEGLAEEVITALARIPGLKVASRTSSFLFKGLNLEPAEIGRRLGVHALVAGTVRKEGEGLRITVELLDVATGFLRWSNTFERPRREMVGLQEEIAARIAEALKLTLVPARTGPAVAVEAYEDFLRGRQYYYRYTRHGMRFAREMFQQALDREPAYGAAWAGIANCAAFLYIYVDRSEANREQAEQASLRALELDPDLADAHASRGVALSAAGRMEEAEAAFQAALALDPNLYEAAYFYARHCLATGHLERAEALFERAVALRPEDCQAVLLVAQVHASLGRASEAEAARRQGLALAEERLRHVPDDVRTRYLGANAQVALGERDKGLAWARIARSLDPGDPMLLYNLGCIHALAHSPEEALDCLEQAVSGGLTQKGWFLHDGDLESVRDHPRFQALLAGLA